MEVVVDLFDRYGFLFSEDYSVIPNEGDDTTLFVCSGMQRFKNRFHQQDGGRLSTLQSCIRTNDIDIVGDGSHLTNFHMLGNFSFGNNDYEQSVELWHKISNTLSLPITSIHVHPESNHRSIWEKLRYRVLDDEECVWGDGDIGGFCCEMYYCNLEIGNLVNTQGHSTDVGFGWERIVQVCENKSRVDETSLFDQSLHPILRDHSRTISVLVDNGVKPGSKGREYVLRRLLRRSMPFVEKQMPFQDLLEQERELRDQQFQIGKRMVKRHGEKSDQFWWETFGILPEERKML